MEYFRRNSVSICSMSCLGAHFYHCTVRLVRVAASYIFDGSFTSSSLSPDIFVSKTVSIAAVSVGHGE